MERLHIAIPAKYASSRNYCTISFMVPVTIIVGWYKYSICQSDNIQLPKDLTSQELRKRFRLLCQYAHLCYNLLYGSLTTK